MRRVKKYGGQKETWPIKDPKQLESFMLHLLKQKELAKTPVKKYQADRNWMLCLIGFNTAFRAEDLLQLRVMDLINGYVSIIENKTGKAQNFRMNNELHRDILEYVKRNNLSQFDYMFLGQKTVQDGKEYALPITRQQAYYIVKDVSKAIGIGFIFGVHSLRKTFGYMFIKNGGSWQTLTKMYNHDDIEVTQRYVMWDIEDAQKERAAIFIGAPHKKKKGK
ncbi:tyrosine-type recombinase/integrase [Paracholeplasma manati]|uniref:tyrosine-type recombinase/integrase n=1 Tax=Paracholeplasma manati TaxID=591373 RepID=UPI0024088969|nr:tyrosine-type recombinase/integrase [Paracholeplasma manati]MDG0887889.1 tyrosine-type recombinase/integrase [Paracholeplasma manati]